MRRMPPQSSWMRGRKRPLRRPSVGPGDRYSAAPRGGAVCAVSRPRPCAGAISEISIKRDKKPRHHPTLHGCAPGLLLPAGLLPRLCPRAAGRHTGDRMRGGEPKISPEKMNKLRTKCYSEKANAAPPSKRKRRKSHARCAGTGGLCHPHPVHPDIQYARSASDMACTPCVAAGFARFGPGTEGPNGAKPPTRRVRCYAMQAAPA